MEMAIGNSEEFAPYNRFQRFKKIHSGTHGKPRMTRMICSEREVITMYNLDKSTCPNYLHLASWVKHRRSYLD